MKTKLIIITFVLFLGTIALFAVSASAADISGKWTAPATLAGAFHFCVESWDQARNKSAPSCARLTIHAA